MLQNIISEPNLQNQNQDHWKASVRKKILALLLFVHWMVEDKNRFPDFFALWNRVYPDRPLPQRQAKSVHPKKKLNANEPTNRPKEESDSLTPSSGIHEHPPGNQNESEKSSDKNSDKNEEGRPGKAPSQALREGNFQAMSEKAINDLNAQFHGAQGQPAQMQPAYAGQSPDQSYVAYDMSKISLFDDKKEQNERAALLDMRYQLKQSLTPICCEKMKTPDQEYQ